MIIGLSVALYIALTVDRPAGGHGYIFVMHMLNTGNANFSHTTPKGNGGQEANGQIQWQMW